MNRVGLLEFVACYTNLVTRLWADEGAGVRLVADPRAVLAESGLCIPSDSRAEVIESHATDLDLQGRLDVWNEGYSTGTFKLLVPRHDIRATNELDESTLGDLAGGLAAPLGTLVL
ncbi:hypothetical protein [Streptomyces sp. NPDC086010]|uniref:hypothetical protein n=1 Tax=Streptomyces sp. NPDC086010 TaxID=3365745 RepID=UPI0037D97AB2